MISYARELFMLISKKEILTLISLLLFRLELYIFKSIHEEKKGGEHNWVQFMDFLFKML